jgi:acyl-CoA thioester hydrolase
MTSEPQGEGEEKAPENPFALPFEVRDYELDVQGIVNTANSQHYLEPARHGFLKSRGVDFVALHDEGLDAVVYRVEIDYKEPLRSGDRFSVSVRAFREGRLKLIFEQEIRKETTGALAARALVTAAVVSRGRPIPLPQEIVARLC